jgi:hypothetical protein
MLLTHYKSSRQLLLLAPCVIVLAISGNASQPSRVQSSTQSSSDAPVYLPLGENDASLLAVILARLGEPSLLEAAKDASVRSFRVSYFSPVPVHEGLFV